MLKRKTQEQKVDDLEKIVEEPSDYTEHAENIRTSVETPKRKSDFCSPRKIKRSAIKTKDSRAEEAYEILKDTVKNRSFRDASTIYGEHIASKHRTYSQYTRNVIEHLIGNILFDADMGKYNAPATVPIPSPSPTDSSCSQYDQNLSYPRSICSSAPSPSNASTTYNQPSYINTPYQQPQTDTTTSLAPLVDYINTFNDVEN